MSNPAETYEREIVPVLFGPWAALLLEAADPQAGERILDVACGTGTVARQAAARAGTGAEVVGVDLSPAMLSIAGAAAAREGVVIQWREGRAEALPFPAGRFDLVLCQQGLQFVPDQPRAVAEMHRVLDDGGRVALSLWRGLDQHPFFATLNDVIVRHLGIPAMAAPFTLGDPETVRSLLSAAGFRDIVIEARAMTARFPDPDGFIAMQVDVLAAAVPSVQHLDPPARAALTTAIGGEMTETIRALTQDGQLAVATHAHLTRARRGPA